VTLIGHSLGGWLAARFAIRNPSQVEHLILINNAGISYPGVIEQAELFKIQSIYDVRNLLDHMWFRYPWYFKPFTLSVYHSLQNKHISEFISSIRETDFLNDAFSSLSMPVDVIWGSEDRLIPVASISVMKRLLPNIRAHFIPQCGHVPQLERPRELTHLLNHIFEKR
jgi:pimeloyl-ACP methyl ester carboxylesterase